MRWVPLPLPTLSCRGRSMPLGRHTILTLAGGLVCAAQLGAQHPTGTIRGRVTDNATQQPISAVTVTVGSRAAQNQADGRSLIVGVPVAPAQLRARDTGYPPAVQHGP